MENSNYRVPLTLDNLIGDDGNWMVCYVYNNWGDSVLMLLPRLDPDHDSEESKINSACMNIGCGTFEEEYAIHQWIKEYPHTPFLVSAGNSGDRGDISRSVEIMKEKIAGYNNDWRKFIDDSIEFDDWRRVVYYVSNTDGEEQVVCHESWRVLKEKAGCNHKTGDPPFNKLFIGIKDVMLPLMKAGEMNGISEDTVVRFNDYLQFRLTRPEIREKYNHITTDCSFDAFLREASSMPDLFMIGTDHDVIYNKFDIKTLAFNIPELTSSIINDFIEIEKNRNGGN